MSLLESASFSLSASDTQLGPRIRRGLQSHLAAMRLAVRMKLFRPTLRRAVRRLYFEDLVDQTQNWSEVSWLGNPIWQNVLDVWVIQEVLSEVRPSLLIEAGTNRGGSSMFYAQLFDLLGGGRVVTVDIEKLHDLSHPRIEYLIGSSTSSEVVERISALTAEADGPVMAILDSDHSRAHVAGELETYAPLITPGSYMLVQDGVIDQLPHFRSARPGPLPAIDDFLARHPEFEVDDHRDAQFLITHHPHGWLRRRAQ